FRSDFQVSEVMSGSDLQTEAAVFIVLLGIRGSVRVARLLRFMFLGSLGTLCLRFLDNSSHSRSSPHAGVRGREAPARGAGSWAPRRTQSEQGRAKRLLARGPRTWPSRE